ncbi:hypothetical protein [Actinomadura chokoriensis]|uniref:hypothetical protein n=1 Tax=Actinomadura chokoriensis TaxID=454156 RepID=UPI0031F808FD
MLPAIVLGFGTGAALWGPLSIDDAAAWCLLAALSAMHLGRGSGGPLRGCRRSWTTRSGTRRPAAPSG